MSDNNKIRMEALKVKCKNAADSGKLSKGLLIAGGVLAATFGLKYLVLFGVGVYVCKQIF